ncbi:MAG TPA: FAD-binding protein [Saprospiraceae bacterium]|nr:FAD-binding protein [Saprospiraceae bacterium]
MSKHPTNQKTFPNRHKTLTFNIDNLYQLANKNSTDILSDYNETTKEVQDILKECIESNKKLRVLGGNWSWSDIIKTNGILLDTKSLNISFTLTKSNLSEKCIYKPEDLHFCQCGVSIKELNDLLKGMRRSLKTSGASNGQTIAGAMSTGTHGAAIDVGAIPDYVVGIHIIVSPTRQIWLERESFPVASESFLKNIGAELVRNDDLFYAAVVSFGSFGFIHGIMVETVPLFLYEAYRFRLNPKNENLYQLMESLDFNKVTPDLLDGKKERPYHFQTLINQYDKKNGAYINIMYKRAFESNPHYEPPVNKSGLAPGDDAPAFIGALSDAIPLIIPLFVNKIIKTSYESFEKLYGSKVVWGTHGEIFSNTELHGKVLSSAMGIPLSEVNNVRKLFLKLNDINGPFCGVIAFRYVKGTKATLGFTKFETTCVVELDCVYSEKAEDFYKMFWDEMFANNIPFTFHWGKLFNLNKVQIRTMYGDNNVDAWIKARNELMKEEASMKLFTNDLMSKLGLDTILKEDGPLVDND